jgi:hypothetical protein
MKPGAQLFGNSLHPGLGAGATRAMLCLLSIPDFPDGHSFYMGRAFPLAGSGIQQFGNDDHSIRRLKHLQRTFFTPQGSQPMDLAAFMETVLLL